MKNKRTKLLDALMILLINFCVIVFGIWISAIPITKSKSFYMNHFKKNTEGIKHLQSDYMFPDEDPLKIMESVADITINYYFGNAPVYQVEINGEKLFNDDEVRHMADVKVLYIGGQIIAVISFFIGIVCLFYLVRHFRRIKDAILKYTFVFYGIFGVLIIAFLIWGMVSYQTAPASERAYNSYFNYLFVNFHHLIFPNIDKFNLATGQDGYDIYTLTRILNSKLFMDAGIIIASVTLTCIIIWFVIIFIFRKNYDKIAKRVDEIHENARKSS